MKDVKIWCTSYDEQNSILQGFEKLNLEWNSGRSISYRIGLYNIPMGFIIKGDKVSQTKSEAVFRANCGEEITLGYLTEISEIKIGDIVEVTHPGATYAGYYRWPGLVGYEDKWEKDVEPVKYKLYKVINLAPHNEWHTDIALIQDQETEQVYIINIKGIKKVEVNEGR